MKTNRTHSSITTSSLRGFPLLGAFFSIWQDSKEAFAQERTHKLALEIALGLLSAFGRRTITRSICARASQFRDWSRTYRFFSADRWFPIILESKLLAKIAGHLLPGAALVVAVDDSHKSKTGRKIPSAGYFYDPKSPRFARSFRWQLRFLTFSALVSPHGAIASAKGILFKLKLAPKLAKPGKRAKDQEKQDYKKMAKLWTITSQLIEQLHLLRSQMDALSTLAKRILVVVADSSYCNKTVIRDLPSRCVLVSRTRKDLVLHKPVEQALGGRGRRKVYGERLPTPDEIRGDGSYPWESCVVFACGKWHELRYKTIRPVLWKSAGGRLLRLVVISPLGYRLKKSSKLLYRNPAYLLISEPDYPVHLAIQHYFHRWEIEVNHREAKTTFGVGQAQVRNPRSVARQFSFAALVYSWLSLAALEAYGSSRANSYTPLPKWRNDPRPRPSALDVVTQLRLELLAFEADQPTLEFCADRDLAPNSSKYAEAAAAWLASTVPRGLSESAWSAFLYADA